MRNIITYRAFIALLIGLFASLQVFTTAHATSYGDAPHEHDGVSCIVSIVTADSHIVLTPVLHAPKLVILTETPTVTPFTSASYLAPQGRAPPPRGPPTFIR